MSKILRDDEGHEYAVIAGPLSSRVGLTVERGDMVVRRVRPPALSVAEALDRVRQVMHEGALSPGSHIVFLRGDKEDALSALIAAVRAEERARKDGA